MADSISTAQGKLDMDALQQTEQSIDWGKVEAPKTVNVSNSA